MLLKFYKCISVQVNGDDIFNFCAKMSIFSNRMIFTVIVISTTEPVKDDSDEDDTDSKPNVRSHTKASCSSLLYSRLASLVGVGFVVLVAVLVMFGKYLSLVNHFVTLTTTCL